jgi:iron complex outermembrane receptor protein
MKKSLALLSFLFSQLSASNLLDLDIEDLTQIEVTNTNASLTKTSNQETPASVTTITYKDIRESGARSLDELLDIYVPSFAYMYKVYGSQMGMRGILSDRNNKILLLVNNRVMNIKTSDSGAVTERWFSMLGDIKKITVITGAGSPIYGSGAIAGVINIETFNADDKQGLEIGAKLGAGEQFGMAEISYATEIFDNSKLYFYYGVDKYSGADEDKAPLQFAFDYDGLHSWNSDIVAPADEPYPYATTNDAASLNHQLRHKVHLQLQNDNYLIWARYTNSSLESPLEQKMFQWFSKKKANNYQHTGTQNQQFTLFGEYKTKPAQELSINYNLSYQRSSLYTHLLSSKSSLGLKAWRDDNFIAKIYGNYNYNDDNLFAFGSEFTYNWLGRDSEIGFKEYSYINKNLNAKEWNTKQLSFFGEYQKHFNSKLTMFVGARADKHSYLEWIYSPRISFVYNTNNEDIFKLCWNHSNRYSDEADLYLDYLSQETANEVEAIDSIEFIYAKYLSDLKIELSSFYNKHEIIAYDSTLQQTTNLGRVY